MTDLLNTLFYRLTPKERPAINPLAVKWEINANLTDLPWRANIADYSEWDASNLQLHRKEAIRTTGNTITIEAINLHRTVQYFDFNTWTSWGAVTIPMDLVGRPGVVGYNHQSGWIDTKAIKTFDIYKPGRIVCECTLPQGKAVPAIWLFFAERPGDPHKPKRSVYFEIDIFETGPSRHIDKNVVFFSAHQGTGATREEKTLFSSTRVLGKFDDGAFHYPEVEWNGRGLWTWRLNGVTVKRLRFQQEPDLKPYLIMSLQVTRPILEGVATWQIKSIKHEC